ncbi:HAD family hydrolase [Roseateles sp. BYS87W]|uniref:HAD family hydrolase n=1 Tax=Pelomonas baiyunensis TaxID=3299026 RepID=A0ABW7GXY7_9BURK
MREGWWANVVLFDLDGTLIDSAADLGRAANAMRLARGLFELPLAQYRPYGGSGARGMLAQAFGVAPGHADYETLKVEFLDRYELLMHETTCVFDGVDSVLRGLKAVGVRWGIVTNKATRFAEPLAARLGLHAEVLVCGDSTPHVKPHPAPLLEAARRIGVNPESCLYVGDDARDIVAGRAAGMSTGVARWGYLGAEEAPEAWGADILFSEPAELLKRLRLP